METESSIIKSLGPNTYPVKCQSRSQDLMFSKQKIKTTKGKQTVTFTYLNKVSKKNHIKFDKFSPRNHLRGYQTVRQTTVFPFLTHKVT